MSAQACVLASQQLWPPPTFCTISEVVGLRQVHDRERGAVGLVDVVGAREHRRLAAGLVAAAAAVRCGEMLTHRLASNACTSALAGAGPV